MKSIINSIKAYFRPKGNKNKIVASDIIDPDVYSEFKRINSELLDIAENIRQLTYKNEKITILVPGEDIFKFYTDTLSSIEIKPSDTFVVKIKENGLLYAEIAISIQEIEFNPREINKTRIKIKAQLVKE